MEMLDPKDFIDEDVADELLHPDDLIEGGSE